MISLLAVASILLGAAFLVIRSLRRKWQNRLDRQHAISEAALDNMAQGLCMFDANHRLITCNRRYAELYQLPEHLIVPGTPGQEMLS